MNRILSGIIILAALLSPLSVLASLDSPAPHGFHWYSVIDAKKPSKPAKPQVPIQSPYEKLMALRLQTKNKLARALLEPSVETTYDYMKAQQFYAKKNQAFIRFWKQALLLHPELDYRLNFPTDNSAIAIRNDMTSKTTEDVIKAGAKIYGLILFYEGSNPISQKFANHFMAFVDASHFETISVATDGALIQGLPNQRKIPLKTIQQKLNLVPHYMPALFLVNLKTQKMTPLSYGFVSTTELKDRFLDLATDYKRYTYEGL
ncbi:MAG: type-F conjugative transfer system pilin assembly protein TraF [Gammaproteobacteria bacterium]|nr:type-F conjugative transfer system pilin assembly protein TraF [Gammaproteobacteria bacterium]